MPNNNVPRVEYDLRSRDARLQLERAERLLVKRDAAAAAVSFLYFRLLSLLSATSPAAAESPNNRVAE